MYRVELALVCTVALALSSSPHAQDDSAPEQIMWSADSWTRSGNTYMIQGLTIEGGDLRIEADRATTTSLEFTGSWDLSGSVRMSVGTARLLADSAEFEFESGELMSGELAGEPATFEETEPEGAGPVRGESRRIVYDSEAGTLQMQGSASFTMGQNSISGSDFLYELEGGLASGSAATIIYVPPGQGETSSDAEAAEDANGPAAEPGNSAEGEAGSSEAAGPAPERETREPSSPANESSSPP